MHTVTPQNLVAPSGPVEPTTQAPDRQPATSETPQAAPDATRAPQVDPQMAQRQAEMARREQMLRRQARQVQAEKQSIAAEKAEIERVRSWQQRLSQDPGSVLTEAGLSGDQITQSILNQPSQEELRLRRIEQENQALRQAQEQQQTASYEQAKKQIRQEANILVNSDKAYETTKALGLQEAIVELIELNFNETGYLMPLEEAARDVEEYALEKALEIAKVGKVQTRLSPAQQQHAAASQQAQKSQLTTLSNRQTPTTSTRNTDRNRRERAIAAFLGKPTS